MADGAEAGSAPPATGEEDAPAQDAPAASSPAEDPGSDMHEDGIEPIDTGKPRGRGRPIGSKNRKRKPLTTAQKAERALRARNAREELARQRAKLVGAAADVAATAPAAKSGAGDASTPASTTTHGVSDQQLALMANGCYRVIFKKIPVKWGGGDISAEEAQLLGDATVAPVKPYLQGESGPWMLLLAALSQVLLTRMLFAPPELPAPVNHTRPDAPPAGTAPASALVPAAKKAPAPKPAAGAATGSYDPADV